MSSVKFIFVRNEIFIHITIKIKIIITDLMQVRFASMSPTMFSETATHCIDYWTITLLDYKPEF